MPESEAWSVGYVVNILPHSAYRCIMVAAGLLLPFETETPVLVRSFVRFVKRPVVVGEVRGRDETNATLSPTRMTSA